MKQQTITASGTVSNDGKLLMYMGEVNQFLSLWKGAKVIISFQVISSGNSRLLVGYYLNYVVPTIKQAFWELGERRTEEATERFLREISPIACQTIPDDQGKYRHEIKEISEMSNYDLIEHIEFLKQYAAENLSCFVDDPKTY